MVKCCSYVFLHTNLKCGFHYTVFIFLKRGTLKINLNLHRLPWYMDANSYIKNQVEGSVHRNGVKHL
uniref:Uncharacterized protein n=1 Tax=Anguilla anguilla TaxID=7936 RepID=A0A0E9W8Y6_ANGAN